MSIEGATLDSIVAIVSSAGETDTGNRVYEIFQRNIKLADYPKFRAKVAHEVAWEFFKTHKSQVANWIARMRHMGLSPAGFKDYVTAISGGRGAGFAFEAAMARITAQEAVLQHGARMAALNATAAASKGTLVAGAGTTVAVVVIPIVGMIAVQLALGAPYYQARELAKKEGYASGFAKGFITGLLQWELRFAIDRFWDNALNRNHADESIPTIRAGEHNQGLMDGRRAGLAKDDAVKKSYLRALKLLTGASAAGWTTRFDDWMEQMRARQVQISYVIELAVAAQKYGILLVE